MDQANLTRLLEAVKSGETSIEDATGQLSSSLVESIGYAAIDHHRAQRKGFPEVIFGQGKTPAQLAEIFARLAARNDVVLATRITAEGAEAILAATPDATWHEAARCVALERKWADRGLGSICVVSAGTSDVPVAEEAALTARLMGNRVETIYDVGVAGIHRLFERLDEIKAASVVIVVAGMEGALPSVVGGLVSRPVIAVPTSVGYGASFQGLAALLGMLNTCASGVTVVNIDNGFGAGYAAALMNRPLASSS